MPKFFSLTSALAVSLLPLSAYSQQTAPKAPATKPKTATTGTTKTPAARKPAAKPRPEAPLVLKTPQEKFSYALGMNLGSSLHKQSVAVDPVILERGLKDALAGKTQMTEDEARAALMAVQAEVRQKMEEARKTAGAANKKEGDAFLAANKAKAGVVALPSGLQYKVLQQGTGPKPAATDSVVCNYRGTLIDGKEFDSSYKRGEPATFPVNGVIKGWTEALQLMPVGSKWQLFVPAELAYGDRGAGADIGPDSTLIFEVELISIQDKNKSQENSQPNNEEKKP
jgi:FKBP-type peptidyl-prolyl cis-trans isomerase